MMRENDYYEREYMDLSAKREQFYAEELLKLQKKVNAIKIMRVMLFLWSALITYILLAMFV